MIKVVYCRDGEVVSDFKAFEFVDRKIQDYKNNNQNDLEVRIANEVLFNIFALRVMEDAFSASDIEFYLEDIKLNWDEYLGIELQNVNDEFGVNLPVINKIIQIGAKKRLTYLRAKNEQEKKAMEKTWHEILDTANKMSGTEFRNWCANVPNISFQTLSTDCLKIDGDEVAWEIDVTFNKKLLFCYYDKNDHLIKNNIKE